MSIMSLSMFLHKNILMSVLRVTRVPLVLLVLLVKMVQRVCVVTVVLLEDPVTLGCVGQLVLLARREILEKMVLPYVVLLNLIKCASTLTSVITHPILHYCNLTLSC